MKIKKRKKESRLKGRGMGGHGRGFRKKGKGTGHRGGKGMSGSGKRADHKKTLVIKLYKHKYFGKQGITSRGTQKDKRKRINLQTIELNLENYIKKGIAKKTKEKLEINLHNYKILNASKDYIPKNKLIIKAKEASKSAIDKIKKAGGQIILSSSPKNSQAKTSGEILINKSHEK